MSSSEPTIAELVARCTDSAVHLEMRDHYGVAHEADDFRMWLETGRLDTDPASPDWAPWVGLVSQALARGVRVRRARIVSEPVSDYIRYEHASTVVNVQAGEDVRWLPRRHASDIALPGNDFWLFDGRVIRWGYFSGNGAMVGHEISDDPPAATLCSEAFEAVWSRAVPHAQYEIH
ncbi:hypothetical protein GTY81_10885 [Streptomyces sp. SID8366]|uniref:DUF6879 family protein n=1 Tax=unclassified Streptomyces TaxID=2593676 RepID=UPI000DBA46B6|nr:DUF6879 family protein [Streptomyces sp. PsTaAH-130]MYU04383.1 hypothetical protein [Streptomyces sp. SID8366]MYU64039.1 hypothetical protein [Streptomyces sp. SID69]RAJ54729.1 hypothetical protein K376_05024 [Streptomyces sp. PsTaAH-130]